MVPANDEADEIAAAMLAQVLDQAGYAAIPFPVDFARDERIGIVDPHENDIFCISAVPPFAFAGAITLARQLQLRFPRTKVIVGVWGFSGNTERALQRFQQSRPHCLVTSFAAAVQYVADGQVAAPVLAVNVAAVTLDHIRSRDRLALGPDGYEAPVSGNSVGVSRIFPN